MSYDTILKINLCHTLMHVGVIYLAHPPKSTNLYSRTSITHILTDPTLYYASQYMAMIWIGYALKGMNKWVQPKILSHMADFQHCTTCCNSCTIGTFQSRQGLEVIFFIVLGSIGCFNLKATLFVLSGLLSRMP